MLLRRAPVLGSHEIRKCLRLGIMFVVVMIVWVVRWSDVFHAIDAAAFGAAFDRALAGHLLWVRERVSK